MVDFKMKGQMMGINELTPAAKEAHESVAQYEGGTVCVPVRAQCPVNSVSQHTPAVCPAISMSFLLLRNPFPHLRIHKLTCWGLQANKQLLSIIIIKVFYFFVSSTL